MAEVGVDHERLKRCHLDAKVSQATGLAGFIDVHYLHSVCNKRINEERKIFASDFLCVEFFVLQFSKVR